MPNIVEGIQNGLRGAQQKLKDANINLDINPFYDGKIEASIGGRGVSVEVSKKIDEVGIKGSITTGRNTTSIGATADLIGAEIDVYGEGSTRGVGSTKIGIDFDPKAGKYAPLPYLENRDPDGRLRVEARLGVPWGTVEQIGKDILDILEADANKATNRAYEDYNNRNRKPPQPGTRSRSSLLNPPGAQPGTISRSRAIQQQLPQSPELPRGTPQTIPTFPVQGSAENEAANKAARSLGGRLPPERFQIPDEIPKTNTRLPKKPQIGGSGVQGKKPGGTRIARPGDMQDLSPNSPTNKPRINQPNTEPRNEAYRRLTPQEKGLFDCLNNGGGEACYKKFNQQKSSNQSTNSGGANIELEFGDPYIGMGV